ncbi:hypothetical protein BGW36DRAFT_304612 [Talaromyces proteolyticus]|uniref:SET domain-containing protein n=1 Tax=Talaromyces proteolyticus TaxID=1131652 RepID=A0AAD4KHM4_9EURO|nr:uncharacterized protein BGW36DRAFT_304612 [Talaromyces proteolyticus]KAH8691369.1 hypothetical protein BGW36DRAFT_304612 [Talaromyces proteolyticus]
MTDTSLLATTPSTGDPYPVTATPHSPLANGAISDSVPFEDEEPYTIKCICAFQDDDGNTVFCEKCETWQHIECYYHGKEVPDEHFCTDCSPSPRYIDGKRATERQRRLREQSDSGDRKAKRAAAKTQKKKQKEFDQVNGLHVRSDSSSRDQPPTIAKKTKLGHKSSVSMTSVSAPPKLLPESRKRSGSVVASLSSPTKSSGPQIPLYSNEFLHLYDNDQGHVNMKSNLVVNLHLLGDMGAWVKDPSALPSATGRSPQDVFTYSDSLDSSQWPELSIKTIFDDDLETDGLRPKWKCLKTESIVHKDQIVGEIKGKIGQLRDYCLDPSNQWPELRHPQPFVFFHPQLPIYIDTREEGSILRYTRRSCRPNVTMKTFITNEVEYHFCFVANQDIAAGSEVTAMWYLDPQLFGSNNLGKQESGDNDQEQAKAIAMSNVLAHFGGCACSPSQNCLLAAVDRRRHPGVKQLNGKRKKKSKSTVSPTSGPRSNSSRAGSEAVNDDDADNRSTSGSARGQARSRDMTPTHPPPEWALPDSELSARDRRKIAAVEKKFEQLEHDQHGGPRKKKRGSATSSQSQPAPLARNHLSSQGPKPLKVDPTAGRHSNSPPYLFGSRQHVSPQSAVSATKRSPLSRSSYVDGSQQTLTRIEFSPLGRRLLKRCHEDSLQFQWPSKRQERPSPATTDAALSPTATDSHIPALSANETEDVEMADAGNELTPPKPRSDRPDSPDVMSKPPLPSPLPSMLAHNTPIPGSLKQRSSNLHVQLPPNNFTLPINPPNSATPSLQSPSDSLQPPQTPGGSLTAPSPVKKKMSLGDYLGRRGTMATPTSEKTQAQANSSLAPPSKPVQATTPPLSTDGEPQNLPEIPKPETPSNAEVDADVAMKDVPNNKPLSPPYVPPPASPLPTTSTTNQVSPT